MARMKPLSDRARQAIAHLQEASRPLTPVLGIPGWTLSAIEELSRCGEPQAIPVLASALIEGPREQMLAAAQAVGTLLSRLTEEELPSLDEWMRRAAGDEAWRRLTPQDLRRSGRPRDADALLLQLASFHGNGFVREEAVRRLALIRHGGELPYLLLRLNDWVPQVRHAASAAVLERLEPDGVDAFVKSLGLVDRLENARRADHRGVLQGISELLVNSAARLPMVAAMSSPSKTIRRASFRLLTRGRPDDLLEIVTAALSVLDPIVRLWAVRAAATGLDRAHVRRALEALRADRSALVRRECLRQWVDLFPDEAVEALKTALLDRNGVVRAEARYHLGKSSSLDVAAYYRDAITTSVAPTLVAALAGLGEMGWSPEDALRLAPYLSHPLAKVRQTAVRYLLRLGGDQYLDAVAETVLDVSPSVSKQASKALRSHIARVGPAWLGNALEASTVRHVRENLLDLSSALPKWESIVCLLRGVSDRDESLAARALAGVTRWDAQYNVSQSSPSRDQLAALDATLTAAEAKLPPSTAVSIRRAMRSFGPG